MILDTNGLSAIADGDRALEPILRNAVEIALPAIVIGEYRYGIWQSHERARYETWLAEAIPNYRLLVVDQETAEYYADIHHELKRSGRPIPANDLWIAALTRQHACHCLAKIGISNSFGDCRGSIGRKRHLLSQQNKRPRT